MTYRETLHFLFSQLPMYQRDGQAAYKADLGNTIKLFDYLDNPDRYLKCVHVAGTNGKGSTSHMLASILMEAGYKCGLYTSPHMKDFRERIKINGVMIPEQYVCDFTNQHRDKFVGLALSFFEMTVGLALQYFHDEKVDVAIIETGMGGRLDSTNIITPLLSVITNIGFDHTQFLGDTLEKIALEKAGIIKPGVPVVIGESHELTSPVFRLAATKNASPITFADQREPPLLMAEHQPTYQQKNIKTVLETIQQMRQQGFVIPTSAVESGIENTIRNTGLQGRWQIIRKAPLTVLDIGHNESGIKAIVTEIRKYKFDHLHLVFGMVNDKHPETILPLLPSNGIYYFCKANIARGLDQKVLTAKAQHYGLKGKAYESVGDAFSAATAQASRQDMIVVGGSTFVVAELI